MYSGIFGAFERRMYTNGSSGDEKGSPYPDYRSGDGGNEGGYGGNTINFPRFRHKGSPVFPRSLNFESSDRTKLMSLTCKPA